MAEHTQSEDVQMRFEAQGWEVLTVDGHDMDAVTKAYRYAKESDNGVHPQNPLGTVFSFMREVARARCSDMRSCMHVHRQADANHLQDHHWQGRR